jgi:hypothetical protein
MTALTSIDLALMAGASYISNRALINQPCRAGETRIFHHNIHG